MVSKALKSPAVKLSLFPGYPTLYAIEGRTTDRSAVYFCNFTTAGPQDNKAVIDLAGHCALPKVYLTGSPPASQ